MTLALHSSLRRPPLSITMNFKLFINLHRQHNLYQSATCLVRPPQAKVLWSFLTYGSFLFPNTHSHPRGRRNLSVLNHESPTSLIRLVWGVSKRCVGHGKGAGSLTRCLTSYTTC